MSSERWPSSPTGVQEAATTGGRDPSSRALRARRWPGVTVPAGPDDGWVSVARLDELNEGGLTCVSVGGHPVLLADVQGTVYALDGWCPHRGAPLATARLEGGWIRCPWHGFRFDARSGASLWPTGWPPLATYSARIYQGMVQVWVCWT